MTMALHFNSAEPLSTLFVGHILNQYIKPPHIVNFQKFRTNWCGDARNL